MAAVERTRLKSKTGEYRASYLDVQRSKAWLPACNGGSLVDHGMKKAI